MHSKFKILLILIFSSQVISCANNYDISPKYNEETKTLTLGKFTVDNITYHRSAVERAGDRSVARVETQVYKSNDSVCKKLDISIATLGGSYVFYNQAYFDILDHFDGRCSIDNVSNLYFMKCELPESLWTKKYDFDSKDIGRHTYIVSTSDRGADAKKKVNYFLPSEKCMVAIKESVLSQMKVKKVRTYNPDTKKWTKG
jgi:hypothetical protein